MVEVLPNIREHIVRSPDTCGGQPRIDGTRIRVKDVAIWHVHQGMSAETIVSKWPHLSLASVYAALTYYYDHRAAIEEELAFEEARYEQLKAQSPSILRENLRRMKDSNVADDSLSSG